MPGKSRAEPFRATQLSHSSLLYTDGDAPRTGKTLIVGIPGATDMFMMPLAGLLQSLDARAADVLVARSSVFKGQSGASPSFTAFAEAIRADVSRIGGYRSIVVLGTSLGGLPAVILGAMLGAERVVAAGPGTPYDQWWLDHGAFDPHEYLRTCDYRPAAMLLVSADCLPDLAHAREISDLVPCSTCCLVPGTQTIGHNSVAWLAKRGKLRGLLEDRLLGMGDAAHTANGRIDCRWIAPTLRFRQS